MSSDFLFAPAGTKATYLDRNGYTSDPVDARKRGLVKGEQYTIEHIEVHDSHSYVYFEELPGGFNTVMFEATYDEPTNEWMRKFL